MSTFGNTNIGANNNSGSANPISCQFTANGTGTITSISWYGNLASNGNVNAGVYSDNAGAPNVLLASSGSTAVNTTLAWQTFTVSLAITNGTVYWLAVDCDQNYNTQYDTGGTNQFDYLFVPQNAIFPSPWGASNNYLAWSMSIYATYAVAGVGLFRQSLLNGLGSGGPFFTNPLGRHRQPRQQEWARKDRIFAPRHVVEGRLLEKAA